MQQIKKGLAFILVLMILVVSLPLNTFAASSAKEIELDSWYSADIEKGGDYAEFIFTPTVSGNYTFISRCEEYEDKYVKLYDSKNELLKDNYSPVDINCKISHNLNANETYTFKVGFQYNDVIGTIDVLLRLSDIVSIEVEDISLIENHDKVQHFSYEGDERIPWMGYSYTPEYTVYFGDGSSEKHYGSEYFSYNGFEYRIFWSDDEEYDNQWEVGNYIGKADIKILEMDVFKDIDITDTFNIEVEPSPIQSVQYKEKTFIANSNGSYHTESIFNDEHECIGETEEFYYYYFDPEIISYTLTNGTIIEPDSNRIEINGREFELEHNYYIDYDNQLNIGNNYIKCSIAGYEFDYKVNIVETPIKSVEVEPVVNIENVSGYYTYDDIYDKYGNYVSQSDEYYRYYTYPTLKKITLKDGTVLEGRDVMGDSFEYNGQYYSVENIIDSQSYKNPWGIGKHEAKASLAGYEFTYQVEICESPVKSVEVEPVYLIENYDGYYAKESLYDEEDNYLGESEEYYVYSTYPDNVTITLNDGTKHTNGFIWKNTHFDVDIDNLQSYKNQWSVGKHTGSGSIAGFDFTYDVYVEESPVKSVTVEPVKIVEKSGGYYRKDDIYNDEGWIEGYTDEYYYYNDISPREYTITLKDGSVYKNDCFKWHNKTYYLTYNEPDQSFENQWKLGKYKVNANAAGYALTYDVEIIDTPIQSVQIDEINLVEGVNGYYTTDSIFDENGLYVGNSPEYFVYNINNYLHNATITTVDAQVYHGNNIWWNGNFYPIQLVNEQSYNNQLKPGSNIIKASIAGYEFDLKVNVSKLGKSEEFEYMENSDSVVITDCFINEKTIEIPSEINGKQVSGVASLGNNVYNTENLIIPDSVKNIGDNVLNNCPKLKKVTFGKNVNNLRAEMFNNLYNLEKITVSAENEYYCTKDDVLYNKSMDTFIAYPITKGNSFVVPKTVLDIEALKAEIYADLSVTFEEGHALYVTIDGVTYTKDMKTVVYCAKNKKGVYEMPDSVTEISMGAFKNCDQLTEVKVSPKVTEIVYFAFASCDSLEAVDLPSGLVSIGGKAFMDTPKLESIELPSTLTSIEHEAFYSSSLKSLVVPDSVEYIANQAFEKTKIKSLKLGKGVNYIGGSAFAYTPVTSLTLPDSLEYLGHSAFYDCKNLKSLKIGSGLAEISSYAFYNTAITKLVVPKNVSYIGYAAFMDSDITDVEFKNKGIYIADYAFMNCPIKALNLGEEMTDICEYAFAGTSISKIDIPDSVTNIMYGAFRDCKDLSKIKLPSSVTHMGGHTFDGTKWYNSLSNGATYLGHVSYNWKGTMGKYTQLSLKNGTTVIADFAFENQNNIVNVVLPEGIKTIGYRAFSNCTSLKSIYIPDSIENIDYDAFYNCNLDKVYFTNQSLMDRYSYCFGNAELILIDFKITSHPSGESVTLDDKASFSIKTSGKNLSYQWQVKTSSSAKWKNTSLTGNDTKKITVTSNSKNDGYLFRCAVTDKNGNTVYSKAAKLTVVAPEFTDGPDDTSAAKGGKAVFSVKTNGNGLKYQWQYRTSSKASWKNASFTGSKTSKLTVSATSSRNGYQFRCIITDENGNKATSGTAKLKVVTPKITTNPANKTVAKNDKVKFVVKASGVGLKYQWQYRTSSKGSWKTASFTGSKTNTMTVSATTSRNGYQFRCVVTDEGGNKVTSAYAKLKVVSPKVTSNPSTVTIAKNKTAKFTVKASGVGLKYQWQYRTSSKGSWKTASFTGSKTTTLSVKATISRKNYQFRCVITDDAGNKIYSNSATLKIK